MVRRKKLKKRSYRFLGEVHAHPEHPFALRKTKYIYNIFQNAGSSFNSTISGTAIDLLAQEQKKEMVEMINEYGKKKKAEIAKELFKDEEFDYYDSRLGLVEYLENKHLSAFTFFLLMNNLNNRIEDMEKSHNVSNLEKRFDEMCRVFKLSSVEKEVMVLMYLLETDAVVGNIINEYLEHSGYNNYGSQRLTHAPAFAIMLELSPAQVKSAFRSNSKLVQSGILDEHREMNYQLLPFLEGADDKPLLQYFFNEYIGESLPLEKHTLPGRDVELILQLANQAVNKRGTNILLYGEPGTGKTEFARSISSKLGRKLFEINFSTDEDNDSKDSKYRLRAFKACQEIVDLETSIILVDEADMLLNSQNSFFFSGNAIEKGMINSVLDDSCGFNIWISNRGDGMDESTLRRFDFAVKFDRLSTEQRINIWQNIFRKNKLGRIFTQKEIAGIAEQYDISAGGIDTAICNTVKIMGAESDKVKFKQTMESFLKNHLQLLDKKTNDNQNQAPVSKNYSIEGLNIKGDMEHILTSLDGYNRQWQKTESGDPFSSLNLLFYGPPGTGKTEFAKYISRRLKRKLIVRRPSDILDPYVGMTERRLRESFELANRENAILFIDEIDSFLGKRENSSHSWEITQVNELLTNMENFKGVLLAATNLNEILDHASLRRFHFKVGFDYLTPTGNVIFYKRFLQGLTEMRLTRTYRQQLEFLCGLTPGDFYAVQNQYRFRSEVPIMHCELMNCLKNEMMQKNTIRPVIGFIKSK